MNAPILTMSNGVEIPALGLGTWQIDDATAGRVVREALEVGYRHIDTAQLYVNEEGVGRGLRAAGVQREEIFLTTKVADRIKSYDEAKASIEESLRRLGTDYLDLLLIHSPRPFDEMFTYQGRDYFDENLAVWHAMEEAYEQGLVRAIGVSNFDERDVENLTARSDHAPMANQMLCNITHYPKKLMDWNQERGILVQAYSPNATGRLAGTGLEEMAAKYGCTLPQLGSRFDLQLGCCVLPKTTHRAWMEQNLALDFVISDEDMAWLCGIGQYEGWKGADSE